MAKRPDTPPADGGTPPPGTPPRLVGHRGWPRRFPENTLAGLTGAVAAGARWLEIDIQMSADGVPVVLHDWDLARTTGVAGLVTDASAAELAALSAGEPGRFGRRFAREPLPTLARVAAWLGEHPGVTLFAEVKMESLARQGVEPVMAAVLTALAPVRRQVVVISFNPPCLEWASRAGWPVGLVAAGWEAESRREAARLQPPWLFLDHHEIPAEAPLWPGPWQWVLYDINAAAPALAWQRRGVAFIETSDIGGLLARPPWGRTGNPAPPPRV